MKTRLKKINSPEPRKAKVWRKVLRLAGFSLGLSVLLALFAVLAIGLPPGLTQRITAQLRESGIPLQIESIRLSTHRGWVLKNARLYSTSPDDLQPLLSAKKLYVFFWPVDWKKPADGWHVKIFVRDLGVSLGRPWEESLPQEHPFRTVDRLKAELTVSKTQITVESTDLRWGGIRISASGSAQFAEAEQTGHPTLEAGSFAQRAVKVAQGLNRLKCGQPPQIELSFRLDENRPENNSLKVRLAAESVVWQERTYEQLLGKVGYDNSIWTLSELKLSRSDREQFTLSGSFNFANSNVQVSVSNSLSATDLFNLLPKGTQSAIAQSGIKPYGRLDFTASAGPAELSGLSETVQVHLGMAQLKRQDLTLDPLSFHLTRSGDRIEVTNIQARANGGPVAGSFVFDLSSKAWTATAQAQCDPAPVGTLTGGGLQEFIGRFRFPTEQPKAELTLSQAGAGEPMTIIGTLSGSRFTCAGVPADRFTTSMIYSNHTLNLAPLHVARGDAAFDGCVQVDFIRSLGRFSATNSLPPPDIARALAPSQHTVLEQFRFSGPVYAAGSGQLDYGTWTNHSFSGTFRAEKIGFGKVQAALFQSDVKASGTQLSFTNTAAQLYGGFAEGSADFDILLRDGTAPYRMDARLVQIDLEQLFRAIAPKDAERTRGQLSGTVALNADAKAGFWPSVQGRGQIGIENGRLAELPLFGGFSRIIQSAFSGFKLFSLTAFSADYELHDGAIRSENARLGGTLISARGKGSYSPETGLDFVVTAEPLRQTAGGDKERSQLQKLAASALKESTAPLFRLLEFRLNGPLHKPEWEFVNLPTDLPKDVSDLLRRSKDK